MERPFGRFGSFAGKHDNRSCHDCHQQSLYASTRQMVLWIADRPDKIGKHAPVPNSRCEGCHQLAVGKKPWQHAHWLAGHKAHFESDSAPLRGLLCVKCHGAEIHRFPAVVAHLPAGRVSRQPAGEARQDGEASRDQLRDVSRVHRRPSGAGRPRLGGPRPDPVTEAVPRLSRNAGEAAWLHRREGSAQGTLRLMPRRPQGHDAGRRQGVVPAVPRGCREQAVPRRHQSPADRDAVPASAINHTQHRSMHRTAWGATRRCRSADSSIRRCRSTPTAWFGGAFRRLQAGGARQRSKTGCRTTAARATCSRTLGRRFATLLRWPPLAASDSFPHVRHTSLPCLTCHVVNRNTSKYGLVFEVPRGCDLCHHQIAHGRNRRSEGLRAMPSSRTHWRCRDRCR